jgi:hypothetical protein
LGTLEAIKSRGKRRRMPQSRVSVPTTRWLLQRFCGQPTRVCHTLNAIVSLQNGRPWKLRACQGVFFLTWPLLLLLAVFWFPSRQLAGPVVVVDTGGEADPAFSSNARREQLERGDQEADLSTWAHNDDVKPPPTDDLVGKTKHARIHSRVRFAAFASGSGFVNKFYYRFENVRLKKRKLTVYYDDTVMTPPTEEYWVDIVSTNASLPQLPTMLVIKGDVHDTNW